MYGTKWLPLEIELPHINGADGAGEVAASVLPGGGGE